MISALAFPLSLAVLRRRPRCLLAASLVALAGLGLFALVHVLFGTAVVAGNQCVQLGLQDRLLLLQFLQVHAANLQAAVLAKQGVHREGPLVTPARLALLLLVGAVVVFVLVLVVLALLVLSAPFLAFFATRDPALLLAHIAVLHVLRVVQAEDRALQARLRHSL